MIRIGIIGDFNSKSRTLAAMNTAIEHAGALLGLPLEAQWVGTRSIAESGPEAQLSGFDALWAAPASPYESAEGMLLGIQYARTHAVPFTAT